MKYQPTYLIFGSVKDTSIFFTLPKIKCVGCAEANILHKKPSQKCDSKMFDLTHFPKGILFRNGTFFRKSSKHCKRDNALQISITAKYLFFLEKLIKMGK